jgi:hypothetical protein
MSRVRKIKDVWWTPPTSPTSPVADSRIDDIPKKLHAEYRLQHGPHRGGEHVRDGRGDLDGEDAGDADEEADDALGSGVSGGSRCHARTRDASRQSPDGRWQIAVRRSTSDSDSDSK